MSDLKLYSMSDGYINYLQQHHSGVYLNKEAARTHTRKYLGTVLCINAHDYFIPLSSPKNSDYKYINGKRTIRKSIIPIMRITSNSQTGKIELLGTLRISHMIPAPASELTLYDLNSEPDQAYKALVLKEMNFIRKHHSKIISNAKLMYKQKLENDPSAGYVSAALDFVFLETKCKAFSEAPSG